MTALLIGSDLLTALANQRTEIVDRENGHGLSSTRQIHLKINSLSEFIQGPYRISKSKASYKCSL